MPRADYNRARDILPKEFAPYGIIAEEDDEHTMSRIGIGYKHEETGVWIDILPVDECISNRPVPEVHSALCSKLLQYRRYYFKHRAHMSETELTAQKNKMLALDSAGQTNCTIMFHALEFLTRKWYLYDKNIIFPLRLIDFDFVKNG